AVPAGLPATGSSRSGTVTGPRSRARVRKEAIWARVTALVGQNRSLAGGSQPRVMPVAARAAMSARWGLVAGTSRNDSVPADGRSRARTRKLAIWARDTGWSGQNRRLVGGSQPRVMPAAARAAMSARWGLLAGT